MVMLFTDPRMLEHIPSAQHPERPERLATVLRHLKRTGLLFGCRAGTVRPATDEELLRVHTPAHLATLQRFGEEGGGQVEVDTWMSPGSEPAARLAAGAAVEAVNAVIAGKAQRAFCAIRPPGHHARPHEPMGFCLYGNVAVAAKHAVETHGLHRVMVIDFDVHHGNGTQEMFYEDGRVAFYSIHRYPFYPGSGAADETGTGRGLGLIRNVPVKYGTDRPAYLAMFQSTIEDLAAQAKPELILISAGFDAHVLDPVGDLGLETEDFAAMTRAVVDLAGVHCGGRVVSLMEGGYNIPVLAGCVEAHLLALGAEPDLTH